jgi:tetratricopeptide (TPR) repeat protein
MRLLRGRNPRRFTAAESFRLFMEGVRSLQLYDEEADKKQANQELLNQHLRDTETFFQKCVDDYPKDILPLYYSGIVLSLKGQVEQARQLQQELTGTNPETMAAVPDELFLTAADRFGQVSERASGDLLAYAEYNQALALAKTGPIRNDQASGR